VIAVGPGVYRRRWTLALTHQRAIERFNATTEEQNPASENLRAVVLSMFTPAARRLAR
jgi:hypothetical protein